MLYEYFVPRRSLIVRYEQYAYSNKCAYTKETRFLDQI